MIRLICGPKGTGKTKIILEEVNKSTDCAKGDVVFITDTKLNARLNFNVRVLYANEFDVNCKCCFSGFVKGLMAGNADIEYLFIDGLSRIIGTDDEDIEKFLLDLKKIEEAYGIKAIVTISKEKSQLPLFAQEFAC